MFRCEIRPEIDSQLGYTAQQGKQIDDDVGIGLESFISKDLDIVGIGWFLEQLEPKILGFSRRADIDLPEKTFNREG